MIALTLSDFEFDDSIIKNFVNLTQKEKKMVRKWRNSDNVRKWMYSDHIISHKEHYEFIETLKTDNKNFYWLVKNKKNENHVGVIYLNRVDFKNKNTYLGIYSNPDSKQKGVGSLLIEALKKIAFDIAKLHTLKLEVVDFNDRAISFYKNMGFTEEGRLKEFVFKDGKWHDVIIMGIINKNKS